MSLDDVLDPVAHHRDVPEPDDAAVRARAHDDRIEFLAGLALLVGTQKDFSGIRNDGATGEIEGGLSHRVGDITKRQTVAPQRRLADLD